MTEVEASQQACELDVLYDFYTDRQPDPVWRVTRLQRGIGLPSCCRSGSVCSVENTPTLGGTQQPSDLDRPRR
jgi:hypothetical protein